MTTCSLLDAELALDRAEAVLAAELPAHMRAFAHAYANEAPTPPAPAWGAALKAALMARAHPLLEDRAFELLRYAAPLAIEDDPPVALARNRERTWDHYDALAAAREAAARSRFGVGFIALMHWLHGVDEPVQPIAWPDPIPDWLAPDDAAMFPIEWAWFALAFRNGAPRDACRIVLAPVHPRCFVVEPGREVIVVVNALVSPASRFAAMHELGHALAGLLVPRPLVRVVDEAAAAFIPRGFDDDRLLAQIRAFVDSIGAIEPELRATIATSVERAFRHPRARARRIELARALDAVERGGGERRTERPPWALWHDPGAQAVYVAAEAIAERWLGELGWSPPAGALADRITSEDAAVRSAVRDRGLW